MGANCDKINQMSTSSLEECQRKLNNVGIGEINQLKEELKNVQLELNNLRETNYTEKVNFMTQVINRYNNLYEFAKNNIAFCQCINISETDIKQLNDLWNKFMISNYTDPDLEEAIKMKLTTMLSKSEEYVSTQKLSSFPYNKLSLTEELKKINKEGYTRKVKRERFLFGLFGKSIFTSVINILILVLLIVLIVFVVKKSNKVNNTR